MKRLIDGETYNRALTGCSIPGENGIFERGFNAGLNVARNLLSVMPETLVGELKATVEVASHEPAVFGEWYKLPKLPETGKTVLVEFVEGGMATGFYEETDKVWRHNVLGVEIGNVARWCYLQEGLPF